MFDLPTPQNGSECCPVSGLRQIAGILHYDATTMVNDLGRIGEVTLNAETCVLVDCYDGSRDKKNGIICVGTGINSQRPSATAERRRRIMLTGKPKRQ